MNTPKIPPSSNPPNLGRSLAFLTLFVLFYQPIIAQNSLFKAENYSKSAIDSLQEQFAKNKQLVPEFLLETLIALSYYPELQNVAIRFVYKDIKTTMSAAPHISSFWHKKNRYQININSKKKGQEGILLNEVPFNGRIGVLGHELAHIADYVRKKKIDWITFGIHYSLSKKFHAKYEKATDSQTIEKGLTWQLYDWADFVFRLSNASEQYRAFKRKYYLLPEEIHAKIVK